MTILTVWVPVAIVATALSGLVEVAVQQSLRQSANDPQIQMAEDAAAALAGGGAPRSLLPAGQVDVARSLAPYLIVFDEAGEPLASSATLDGQVPRLPPGVFDYTRVHTEDRITYQPRPGVRSAIVVVRFGGERPGFVLAGRSLREVEKREDQLTAMVALAWVAALAASLVATVLFSLIWHKVRPRP